MIKPGINAASFAAFLLSFYNSHRSSHYQETIAIYIPLLPQLLINQLRYIFSSTRRLLDYKSATAKSLSNMRFPLLLLTLLNAGAVIGGPIPLDEGNTLHTLPYNGKTPQELDKLAERGAQSKVPLAKCCSPEYTQGFCTIGILRDPKDKTNRIIIYDHLCNRVYKHDKGVEQGTNFDVNFDFGFGSDLTVWTKDEDLKVKFMGRPYDGRPVKQDCSVGTKHYRCLKKNFDCRY